MNGDVLRLTQALVFAANAHANQRRKGAAQEPYLNHLIEVLDLVAQSTKGEDTDLLIAALLQNWKQIKDLVERPRAGTRDTATNQQILLNIQRRKKLAPLGHHGDAHCCNPVSPHRSDRLSSKENLLR